MVLRECLIANGVNAAGLDGNAERCANVVGLSADMEYIAVGVFDILDAGDNFNQVLFCMPQEEFGGDYDVMERRLMDRLGFNKNAVLVQRTAEASIRYAPAKKPGERDTYKLLLSSDTPNTEPVVNMLKAAGIKKD